MSSQIKLIFWILARNIVNLLWILKISRSCSLCQKTYVHKWIWVYWYQIISRIVLKCLSWKLGSLESIISKVLFKIRRFIEPYWRVKICITWGRLQIIITDWIINDATSLSCSNSINLSIYCKTKSLTHL